MRKYLWISPVLIAVSLLSAYATLRQMVQRLRIHPDSAQQIRRGMTRAEVESILGAPPGNYSLGGRAEYFGGRPGRPFNAEWVGDEAALFVAFDERGVVLARVAGEVRRDEDWFFKLRVSVGLGKRPLHFID
jgi:hypothetical protein